MKLVEMKCNNCGSKLKVKESQKEVTCEYCGTHYKIEDDYDKGYKFEKGRMKAQEDRAREVLGNFDETYKSMLKMKKRIALIFVFIAIIIFFAGIFILNSEVAHKESIDPFEYIEILYSGTSGSGRAYSEIMLNDQGINNNNLFVMFSKNYNLTEGEEITVTVSSYTYDLTLTSKKYTVSGLDTYLNNLNNISNESLEVIHDKTRSTINKSLSTFSMEDYIVSRENVKMYLLTDMKNSNILYDVEKVKFKFKDGSVKTYYLVAYYKNIIVRDTDTPSINYSTSMYTGNLYTVYSGIVTGYESLKDLKADILTHEEKAMTLLERSF